MKLKLAALTLLSMVLLATLFVANRRRQQSPAYLLSRYPKSVSFDVIVRAHLNGQLPTFIASARDNNADPLFYSTWFEGEHRYIPIQQTIDEDGFLVTSHEVLRRNTALTATIPLPPVQFQEFKAMLQQMPPSQPNPTLANLLIVSFRDGKIWTTRIYDRSKLPPQVVRAHQILDIRGFDQPPRAR